MKITEELLKTIFERVEQVFIAKTGFKPDTIEMYDDGFNVSRSWNISYGGVETESEYIRAEELNSDLDDIIKDRKEKEKIERLKNEKLREEAKKRHELEQKIKREIEYNKLKQEFEK
jgi:hypothetical protein